MGRIEWRSGIARRGFHMRHGKLMKCFSQTPTDPYFTMYYLRGLGIRTAAGRLAE
jgi:hypothetical protein